MVKEINTIEDTAGVNLIYGEDTQYTAGHRPRSDSEGSDLPPAPVDKSCQPLPHGSVAPTGLLEL